MPKLPAALSARKPEQVGRFRCLIDRGLAPTGSLAVRERARTGWYAGEETLN